MEGVMFYVVKSYGGYVYGMNGYGDAGVIPYRVQCQ